MRLANEAHGEVRVRRAGGKAGCKAVATAQLIEREAGALLAFQERLHHAGVLLARDRARGVCQRTARGDPIELLTGETPHLTGYTLTRADEGLAVKRRSGLEYLHKAPHYRNKLCEPFFVTADYRPELQDKPIHLSYHAGQELDYILEGRMRFQYEEHTEELGPGDMLLYDSGRGHGMIAIDGAPCKFLAVVLKAREDII